MVDEVDKSNEISDTMLRAAILNISSNIKHELFLNCQWCNEPLLDEKGNSKPRKFCNSDCADEFEKRNK